MSAHTHTTAGDGLSAMQSAKKLATYVLIDVLVDKAIARAAGAKRVRQCVKIEGSFNRAFVLKLDTGASVVARIPFPHAGPRRLTTHSEVATLRYSKPNSPRCYRRH